jgi:hypothetical protein
MKKMNLLIVNCLFSIPSVFSATDSPSVSADLNPLNGFSQSALAGHQDIARVIIEGQLGTSQGDKVQAYRCESDPTFAIKKRSCKKLKDDLNLNQAHDVAPGVYLFLYSPGSHSTAVELKSGTTSKFKLSKLSIPSELVGKLKGVMLDTDHIYNQNMIKLRYWGNSNNTEDALRAQAVTGLRLRGMATSMPFIPSDLHLQFTNTMKVTVIGMYAYETIRPMGWNDSFEGRLNVDKDPSDEKSAYQVFPGAYAIEHITKDGEIKIKRNLITQ